MAQSTNVVQSAPSRPTRPPTPAASPSTQGNPVTKVLTLPPRWLHMYSDFITKNQGQVSQIETGLRSLMYIIPGRFRDAEIASETVHSGVQLLTLYHDAVLRRAAAKNTVSAADRPAPTPHARYTQFWTAKSGVYRRVALLLQVVQYTELLWEMAAARRGQKIRWRVVIVLEVIKAVCRLLLMRITHSRPIMSPALPEREPIVPNKEGEDAAAGDDGAALRELMGEDDDDNLALLRHMNGNGHVKPPHEREWKMPRTRSSLPSLPNPSDIGTYLQARVLRADDIKPAAKLLNSLSASGQAAESLHILAPLIYAIALSRSRDKKSWTPWIIGLTVEYAARQLRDTRSLRTTTLEQEEWGKRYWGSAWWLMRGAFYQNVTKGLVTGVRSRMPSFVGTIVEDYEYLWENYYFSTVASS
ncbi:Peroxisomal membrane protein (Pex16) [Microdochium nivale]|nr:Peroxisomal membrane protein (Pex16) [Microdochium nivale]